MSKSVWFSIGGSHRQYTKDIQKLKNSGIPYKTMGSKTLGSKRISLVVNEEYAEQISALGFPKDRTMNKLAEESFLKYGSE